MKPTSKSKPHIPAVATPTPGTFNGHPVLTLPNPDDPAQPGLQFGVKKLRAMLAHLEACRAFVREHPQPAKSIPPRAAEAKLTQLTGLLAKLSGLSAQQIEEALASSGQG